LNTIHLTHANILAAQKKCEMLIIMSLIFDIKLLHCPCPSQIFQILLNVEYTIDHTTIVNIRSKLKANKSDKEG